MMIEIIAIILSSMFIWIIAYLAEDKQLKTVILYTSGALQIVAVIIMFKYGYNTIVLPNILQHDMGGQIKII